MGKYIYANEEHGRSILASINRCNICGDYWPCRDANTSEHDVLCRCEECKMADACSRCNGRGTPWGCPKCGKKVPETS
jgi:hypothetical protein